MRVSDESAILHGPTRRIDNCIAIAAGRGARACSAAAVFFA